MSSVCIKGVYHKGVSSGYHTCESRGGYLYPHHSPSHTQHCSDIGGGEGEQGQVLEECKCTGREEGQGGRKGVGGY